MRRDTRQRALEIREPLHDAQADAAAARLVAGKRGAIQQPDAHAGERERTRGGCARRTGADDEHFTIVEGRSRGDHRQESVKTGLFCSGPVIIVTLAVSRVVASPSALWDSVPV